MTRRTWELSTNGWMTLCALASLQPLAVPVVSLLQRFRFLGLWGCCVFWTPKDKTSSSWGTKKEEFRCHAKKNCWNAFRTFYIPPLFVVVFGRDESHKRVVLQGIPPFPRCQSQNHKSTSFLNVLCRWT